MLHVKCNCRFEQRGGDDRLMGSLIHGMLHLEEKANKSWSLDRDPGCIHVCLCVILWGERGRSASKQSQLLTLNTHTQTQSHTPTPV